MIFSTANWGWPQWAFLALAVLTLLVKVVLHGKPREPNNGFYAIIDFGIGMFILIAGGFFK